jgi:hypothetical protein
LAASGTGLVALSAAFKLLAIAVVADLLIAKPPLARPAQLLVMRTLVGQGSIQPAPHVRRAGHQCATPRHAVTVLGRAGDAGLAVGCIFDDIGAIPVRLPTMGDGSLRTSTS